MTPYAGIERVPELVGTLALSNAEVETIVGMLDSHEPLVEPGRFNALVAGFGCDSSLDPYRVVCALAACSPEITALLRSDLGLSRTCRLHEHTQGVLDGLESDYIQSFPAASHRKVLRLAMLLGDIGKSLCVAVTGSNREQATYNAGVVENLLATLTTDTLTVDEQDAVRELGRDIIGGALQGRFDHRELEDLRVAWPQPLARALDDLMVAAYLADASAHTEHRSYRDADTLELVPCIAPGDESLTWLFEHDSAGRLALRLPEHRQIVRVLFGDLRVTASLVAPVRGGSALAADTSAAPRFEQVAVAEGTWSAVLQLGSVPFAELRRVLERFAREDDFPISAFVRARGGKARALTLVRDPSATFGTPSVGRCERVVEQLVRETGWRHDGSMLPPTGFTVGLGLREGYDSEAPTHPPYEALARLLAHAPTWHTATAQLVSARAIDGEVEWYDEPGIVISAKPALLPIVVDLAHAFCQRRFAVTDRDAGRTYALRYF